MLQTIRKYDRSNLLGVIRNFPEDSKTAFDNAQKIKLPGNYNDVKNLIISGMGGSCISGDLLRSYLYNKSELPVIVNRSAHLPRFANENTLCVFISYSGGTAETISCAKEAFKLNCKCIVITHGGELEQLAIENNAVLVKLTGTVKMPRAAIGELFYSLLGILAQIDILKIDIGETEDSIKYLDEIRKEVDIDNKSDNWLIDLASNLINKKIAVFGTIPVTEAIALRWKNQFNENSKSVVLCNSFPELTHNEIVGLCSTDIKDYYFLVLRDESEDTFLKKQVDTAMSFFHESAGITHFIQEGKTMLERQMKLLYIGDYLSIYLALFKGLDPTPIEAITLLKEKMK